MGRHRAQACRTLRLDVTRLAACVPVAVLVASTAAVAADARLPDTTGGGVAQTLVVPETPIIEPGSVTAPDRPWQPPAAGSEAATAQVEPASAGRSGSPGVPGIPARALQAYQHAERLLAAADPACQLDWELVAAIGMVESHHGSYGGNRLDADGVARPGIYGIPLDGRPGTARILDTDGGALDRDTRYDRAVGPMQFIPGTWRLVGSDAEPDGRKDPQDIDDAAAAAGVYLCSGPGDLSDRRDRYAAVFRYNHSDAYVRRVLAIADAYARGQGHAPASVLAAGFPDGAWARDGERSGSAASTPGPAPAVMTPVPPASESPDSDPVARREPAPSGSTSAPAPVSTSTTAVLLGEVAGAVGGAVAALPAPAPTGTTAPVTSPSGQEPGADDPVCVNLLGIPVLCPVTDQHPR